MTTGGTHAVSAPALRARALPKPHLASALSVEKQATGRGLSISPCTCPAVQLIQEAKSKRGESLQVTGQKDDFQAQDPRYQCCGIRGHLQEAATSSRHRSLLLLLSSSSGTAGLLYLP